MRRPLAILACGVLVCAFLGASFATAEQSGRDGIVARFNGRVTPKGLFRQRPTPVSLVLSGHVESGAGSPSPRLTRLELAFGARGGLDTAGLARCPRARLRNASTAQALARCRAALVGRGTIMAEVPLAPDHPLRARARVLAFNGRAHGAPAIWLHGFSSSPPVTFVLPFYLHRRPSGPYGLLLRAPVARSLGRWPRLESFRITLARRYRVDGREHSYLNARCALPPRFDHLAVPIARARYSFAPRTTIAITVIRACRVRE